mmetsp:Transcript_51093/g.105100  ORF Transcript_51093/g.105100 Transcript_51093/m.105100 type:complete len:112 (+) Transcript_51093:803-1138(+)
MIRFDTIRFEMPPHAQQPMVLETRQQRRRHQQQEGRVVPEQPKPQPCRRFGVENDGKKNDNNNSNQGTERGKPHTGLLSLCVDIPWEHGGRTSCSHRSNSAIAAGSDPHQF